ncbi:unnamed protein product [Parascedosporium putredinis]|uniref:FAD-binding domain-containing protein n=1 Tax=Parascedosporium putredinis TaxID=1442378 RepID=A0A9P1H8M7_9PEZI|nr:unnamed protein product [Parascedosporium putredinis]CAI8002277.1 unnamed protein product [Parascedosporium putredinis]
MVSFGIEQPVGICPQDKESGGSAGNVHLPRIPALVYYLVTNAARPPVSRVHVPEALHQRHCEVTASSIDIIFQESHNVPHSTTDLAVDGVNGAGVPAAAANGFHTQAETTSSFAAVPQRAEVPGDSPPIETEFLVVGCGPAGAGLACFLASHGLTGIMIGAAPGTANTPRAHITNMAAVECLRDIDLERDIKQVASKGDSHMVHTRWCHSMAGQEFARLYSWGNDPKRRGDYELASPCEPADLPQTLLEPVLIRYATLHGFKVRFDTALESFTEDPETKRITVTVRDKVSGAAYRIRTKYLFGADGAQSQVVKQVDLPLDRKPGQGLAINVLVKANLSHLVDSRRGNLHWVMQPDKAHPDFGWMCIVRMVKPWDEWMFILFPNRDADPDMKPTNEQYLERVRELIGDDTPAEILNVSKWFVNETVAQTYSVGDNVFCLGDAVHRHPPMNGLGSNTCIQDAFNLAWKVAYVHKGLASPSLLDTYSTERQPVGHSIISRANQAFRDHFHRAARSHARRPERRRQFREAIERTSHEFHGLGVEMNQHYAGAAVYDADEPQPWALPGRAAENPVLYHEPNTYPGSRLPHVWLNRSVPEAPTSTIDLAGHGRFVLFTGIGGEAWKEAAQKVAAELGVPLDAHSVGFRQDWEDFYFAWEKVRGVEESGAVLVRPDRFVAWRANEVLAGVDECATKLSGVLKSVLGRKE